MNASSAQVTAQPLTFSDLLAMLRRHRRLFVAVFLVVCVASLGALALLRPRFTSQAAMYVDNSQRGGALAALGSLAPMLGQNTSIESAKELLRSHDLMAATIAELGMNATLKGPDESLPARPRYWQWRWGRDLSPYQRGLVVRQVQRDDLLAGKRRYQITFTDPTRFTVVRHAAGSAAPGQPVAGELGNPVAIEGDHFTLHRLGDAPVVTGRPFELTVVSPQTLFEAFAKRLSVDGGGKIVTLRHDLIQVRYASASPFEAQEVVRVLCDRFMATRQAWSVSAFTAVLEFIQTQSQQLRQDLETATAQMVAFQRDSGLLNLDTQVPVDINRLVETETRQRMGELQLIRVRQILEGIEADKPIDAAVMAYADDPVIRSVAEKLSLLNLEIAGMESRYQPGYAPLEEQKRVRQSLVAELKPLLQGYVSRLENNQLELARLVKEYRQALRDLPASGKILAEHMRSARLYEQLYLFLLQEEQKARMALANTISDIRLVDPPLVPLRESSPRLVRSGLMALAGSFFLAGLAVLLQVARTTWFNSAQEIRHAFAQPVFSVMPERRHRVRRAAPQTIEADLQTTFAESVRQLRTNLVHSSGGRSRQVVMVTSAMPGEGKSTVAANLAVAMTRSEQVGRLLLIDSDIQKPSLHTIFNLPVTPGLTDYLNGHATLEQVIQTLPLDDGRSLDVITAGPYTPSAVELLETQAMKQLLDEARTRYAMAVVDAPPYPLTTSPLILAGMVDRILTVCRVGRTDRLLLRRHVAELSAVNSRLGLIINGAEDAGGYGYGYGYGYGGGRKGKAAR